MKFSMLVWPPVAHYIITLTSKSFGLQCLTYTFEYNLVAVLRRRIQYLLAFAGMTAIFAVWTGVSARYDQTGDSGSAYAVVAMIFVYYLFYTIMHPLTYIYITEVFPFVHRAKGVAMTQFFSRAGSAFNQFVNPIGLDNIGWRFYIVYVVRQ